MNRQLDIHYGDITKSNELEAKIISNLAAVEDLMPPSAMTKIWLSSENSQMGPPSYKTQLSIKNKNFNLFIRKSNSHLLKALSSMFEATRKSLKRRKEKINEFKKTSVEDQDRYQANTFTA